MRSIRFLFAIVTAFVVTTPALAADKLKPEDIIAKHLASIGTPEARAAAKTRLLEGKVDVQEVVRGSSAQHGSASFACDDRRIKVAMKFPGSVLYPFGEQWLFDGKQAQVAFTAAGTRSVLGSFLYHNPDALREGLLGGSMCTSWSLLDAQVRQAKLKYDGLKKIEGREVHQISYVSKKGGSNMEIRLFFDPETFRHVGTSYRLNIGAGIGSDVGQHPDEVRYMMDENFSDFQTVDGLTLPSAWTIRLEVQPSKTSILEWHIKAEKIQNNAEL